MRTTSVETDNHALAVDSAYMNYQFNTIEKTLNHHRLEDPDLCVLINKRQAINELLQNEEKNKLQSIVKSATLAVGNPSALPELLYHKKIAMHQQVIHAHAQQIAINAVIISRTTTHNIKQLHKKIAEKKNDRSDRLSVQIQAWWSLLPTFITGFKQIKDPRYTKSITDQFIVMMFCSLFVCIVRLKSRRGINRKLTGAILF